MTELLRLDNIKKHFPVKGGFWGGTVGFVYAVDGVSVSLKKGDTLGLVGESGCGKSTLGRTLLKLHEPTSGEIYFEGENITALTVKEMRSKRRDMQIIFQDPFSSLNPRMTVEKLVGEPFLVHGLHKDVGVEAEVIKLLDLVGLSTDALHRYPHEFSGGQRQRIGIARALALKPKLIVADEPVSALDVSIQSQVLNLLVDLRRKLSLTYIFISHDLAVIEHVSDFVAVMYLGKIVEYNSRDGLYRAPLHPYTRALMDAIPKPFRERGKADRKVLVEGDVPSPMSPPSGCSFHPRCPIATERCRQSAPRLRQLNPKLEPDQMVACHHV